MVTQYHGWSKHVRICPIDHSHHRVSRPLSSDDDFGTEPDAQGHSALAEDTGDDPGYQRLVDGDLDHWMVSDRHTEHREHLRLIRTDRGVGSPYLCV